LTLISAQIQLYQPIIAHKMSCWFCLPVLQSSRPRKQCEQTLESFGEWRRNNLDVKIAHIKGFGDGMGKYYLEDALAQLKDFDAIAFDGDSYSDTGFTALVPLFLRLDPRKRAFAFKFNTSIKKFKANWNIQNAWDQITIVSVEKKKAMPDFAGEISRLPSSLPKSAVDFYVLGRAAIKATGATHVVCLGGGGITGWEAEATLGSDVTWVIFALSRGRKEEFPTIMDWAVKKAPNCPSIKLLRGKDASDVDAFVGKF